MENTSEYILKVSNLTVELQNQIILEHLNFKVKRGSALAIVGPNGAGKTMLFKTLLNLIPHSGKVEWAEDVRIGYVPQYVSVKDVPISVKEFLSYQKGADVDAALTAVKLESEEFQNKTLSVLSGGQLRRVLIAWALVDNPNVLLFDEPTVGVDVGGEESVFFTLRELKQKRNITLLLITHDIHLVKEYTDELLGLNKCVTFFGDSQQIAEPSLQQKNIRRDRLPRRNIAMSESLVFSLIVGASVGLAAGYLGSIMVLEKMALVGDAMSHVALPGLALGVLIGFTPLLGGFLFLFVSAIVIWHIGRVTKLSFETLVGAAFTLALAVGILLFRNLDELEAALFGNIAQVDLMSAVAAVAISVVVIFLTRFIYRRVVLSLISEELATSKGISVAKTNLLYLLLVSATVAIGIQITGTLLVGFLVVTPAAAARIVSGNLTRYVYLSAIFGAISAISGILLSGYLNVLPGPLVVISGVIIFAAVLLFRWRKKIQS